METGFDFLTSAANINQFFTSSDYIGQTFK